MRTSGSNNKTNSNNNKNNNDWKSNNSNISNGDNKSFILVIVINGMNEVMFDSFKLFY